MLSNHYVINFKVKFVSTAVLALQLPMDSSALALMDSLVPDATLSSITVLKLLVKTLVYVVPIITAQLFALAHRALPGSTVRKF